MERKRTQLEQKIIDKGFKLECKTYSGKKSQFIEYYVYTGFMYNYKISFYLNGSRDKIHHYTIENKLPRNISIENINEIEMVYHEINDFIDNLNRKVDDDEVVEVLEAINENE